MAPRLHRCSPVLAVGAAIVLAVSGCTTHTVAISFEPEISDQFRFRSEITTVVEETVDGRTERTEEESVLDATESVRAVSDEDVTIDVALERDGAPARTYTVRYDRGDRLTAIDLIEGIPADAIGYDLATTLPSDLASPPPGPLAPGQRWKVDRVVGEGDDELRITGDGIVESLGVIDGRDIATVVLRLRLPIRSQLEAPNGSIELTGYQRTESRSVYDLDEGAVISDDTTIEGTVDALITPPANVDAEAIPATVTYDITTRTVRVAGS